MDAVVEDDHETLGRDLDMQSGRQAVGHPIDVATGTMYMTREEVNVRGKVNLTWERRYSTALLNQPASPLGPGWTTRYFATLTQTPEGYRLITPEGNPETFADPESKGERGEVLRILGSFLELQKRSNQYYITHWDPETGVVERFVFRQGVRGQPWPLTSIENLTGQGLDLVRDGYGRLITIRQRIEKRSLQLDYNGQSQIGSVTAVMPSGRTQLVAQYEYDREGRLLTAYDALGHPDRYEYDDDARMTRERVKDGGGFFFRYDADGRCVHTAGPDNYDAKSLRFLENVGWTEVTDSLGHITRYEWLPSGQVISEVNPLGGIKKTEYDEEGRVIARIDANGNTTQYAYDEQGNRSQVTDPLGNTSTIVFDERHQPVEMTDPAGNSWKRTYDAQGNWIAMEDPLGNQWFFKYDYQGNLIQVTDPAGSHRLLYYSDNGVLTAYTDWAGHRTSFEVDGLGRVIQRTDALDRVTQFRYDALGQPIEIIFPDEAHLYCRYDAGGNLVAVTNRDGTTTRFRFGTCGRLLERIGPMERTVRYRWGSEPGRLLEVVNEKGERYRFEYDAAGHIVRDISFDGRTLVFEYDAAGNTITTINGLGERIEYAYDAGGRVTQKTLPGGSEVTVTYDAHGNVISATNSAVTVNLERDPLGRVTKEEQGTYVIENRYDVVGNRIHTQTNQGYDVAFAYDPRGYLTRFETGHGHWMRFEVDAVGLERQRVLPGGLVLKQAFNTQGQVTDQYIDVSAPEAPAPGHLTPGGAPVQPPEATSIRRAYTYDAVGNLTRLEDGLWGTTRYVYDPAERLLEAIYAHGFERFTYDSTNNITSIAAQSATGEQAERLSYRVGNQLIQQGDTQYVYDANARLIQKVEQAGTEHARSWTYTWDGDDQLIALERPDGSIWRYTYDPFGRRIAKEGNDGVVRFIWNRYDIIQELDGGQPRRAWVYDPHRFKPLAQLEGDACFSIITDHLGAPRELLDRQGRIVWAVQYRAWGGVRSLREDSVQCPLRAPGQWADAESGLHYSWYRYYDPENGRFLCLDPIGINGGLNEYVYAPNAINWIDPLGLNGCDSDDETPVRIVIDADKYPEAAQHISDNGPVTGRIDRGGASSRRRQSLKGVATASGLDRDEVPPAVLDTGGAGASVRLIPSSDNRGAGSTMGHQMRDLDNGTLVEIVSSKDV